MSRLISKPSTQAVPALALIVGTLAALTWLGMLPARTSAATVTDGHLYWSVAGGYAHEYDYVPGSLWRSDLSGANATGLPTGSSSPDAIAVDQSYIYWTDGNAIWRSNLAGTAAPQTVLTLAADCVADALALDSHHIYWACSSSDTMSGEATIGRANLDGTNPEPIIVSFRGDIYGLAVNSRHIYWTNPGAAENGGLIGRANLSGGQPQLRFVTGIHSPGGLAVDGRHLYWGDLDRHALSRAALNGTDVRRRFIRGAGSPAAIAIGLRHIYWSNGDASNISRAARDGSHLDYEFIRNPAGTNSLGSGPAGLAVGP